jgi:hypothetical protein
MPPFAVVTAAVLLAAVTQAGMVQTGDGRCSGERCGPFDGQIRHIDNAGCGTVGIGIISASANIQRRMASRDSWQKHPRMGEGTVRYFVAAPANPLVREQLALEAAYFKDMVLVDSVERYSRTWVQVRRRRSAYFSSA